MARRVDWLLRLLKIVGPLSLLFAIGFGWVGVTVLLLQARDPRVLCCSVVGTILNPRDLQVFLASTMDE